jgi:hypothetical protein
MICYELPSNSKITCGVSVCPAKNMRSYSSTGKLGKDKL